MIPTTWKLKPWLKSEAEATTVFLQQVRHEWLWYKIPDMGNSMKFVDVIFYSRLYWSGTIEFKISKNKKLPDLDTAISLCEPHQLRILHQVSEVNDQWYIWVYHQISWIIYFFKFKWDD